METSIAVTGLGLVTALGHGADETWRRLAAGESGIRPAVSIGTGSWLAGEVPGTAPAEDRRERVRRHLEAACREALAGAGIASGRAPVPERAALVVGSSLASGASAAFWEAFVRQGPGAADCADLAVYDVEPFLDGLCRAFDLRAGALLAANACAAGASSIALAADQLRAGRADLVLACGAEGLDLHTLAGFGVLGALAPRPMRPFAPDRDGMHLSDGFAALVLEREDAARAAGRRPLARLLGYGESADAHHRTQPHPQGLGAALAMRRALEMAGLPPDSIDYVNLHATATPANDLAEFRALREIFGARLALIPLNATKPALGHALGAAGTVEAAVTLLVLAHQRLPPTLGAGELEPEMGRLDLVPAGRPARVRHAMSNSFGFGGSNASLVFGAVEHVG